MLIRTECLKDVGWLAWLWSRHGLYAISLPCTSVENALGCLDRPGLVADGRPMDPDEERMIRCLRGYFSGERVDFKGIPVDWSGQTPFTRLVLEKVGQIGYGKTMSYLEVATAVGHSKAARAVGGALRRNRTPIVVPCHRVLRSGGGIGGWSGAPGWKERLLAIEGIVAVQ